MTFQHLIDLIDCSEEAVNNRRQIVRDVLNRIKSGTASPEEKKLLTNAMKGFKKSAVSEGEKLSYNSILCFYFAEKPLKAKYIAGHFNVDKNTVFRHIKSGIETLTILLYGVGGVCLLPMGESDRAGSGHENARTQMLN